jgi:ubiquitin-protein ligase
MEQKLSIISSSFLKKRLKSEIEFLIEEKICLENTVHINQVSDKPEEYIINFKNIKDYNNYKFVLSHNYPFHPPKLYINEKFVSFNHKIINKSFNKSLKKYTGIECFCCETILCSNNWKPVITFDKIIDDINNYKDARRQVIHRLLIDIIKRKYLIYDINIVEWLYN